MPKNPPNLARLIQSADPADRVQVQQTDFAYDVMARYTCNDWAEVQAALTDGGFPFDAVVIGCGMLGGFIAEKLFHAGAGLGFRILVLEAGAFALPTHIQNLPQRLGGSIGGPAYTRKRDDASGLQNVVWGMPWISNEDFPGLAYCVGGRSLFWGGWTPRLLPEDLAAWPPEIAAYLDGPEGYARTEVEIGTVPVTDYMQKTTFHDELNQALVNAARKLFCPDSCLTRGEWPQLSRADYRQAAGEARMITPAGTRGPQSGPFAVFREAWACRGYRVVWPPGRTSPDS
jgi:choline dehydrogenase-like flavoprotein